MFNNARAFRRKTLFHYYWRGWAIEPGVFFLPDPAPFIAECRRMKSTCGQPNQNGVRLDFCASDTLDAIVQALRPLAQSYLGHRAKIDLLRSSFREQDSSAPALAPHQDQVIAGRARMVTFWCPLVDIDARTPTLGVGRRMRFQPHIGDANGYAVAQDPNHALQPIDVVSVGDVVVLHPRTIHGSYVPAGARRTRYSLDIRALVV
jgi:hypothetical protein